MATRKIPHDTTEEQAPHPSRKPVRLAPGPAEPVGHPHTTHLLQDLFFSVVIPDVVPAVFETLRENVYPAFKECRPDDPARLPELLTWAAHWHVEAPWFLGRSFDTLRLWAVLEPHEPETFWQHRATGGGFIANLVPEPTSRNVVELPGWSMQTEHWEDFERRMDAAYEAHKALYRAHIERVTHQVGGSAPPTIRAQEHIVWFCWYQVGQLSYKEITTRLAPINPHGIGEDAVRKAVHAWAELLDLPVRKAHRGRPPGR